LTNPQVPSLQAIAEMDEEQLPVARHKLHNWPHFFGLYGAEHVAATEFVFGATFVALGAGLWDILIGLLIGNLLATLSFTLLTARIAVDTRLSLYTYLDRIAGGLTSRLYNGANIIVFAVISAAMITVSATAFTALAQLPPQVEPYPTDIWFVVTVVAVAVVVVLVAVYGFNALSEFASTCAPWLMLMFTTGGMVLVPALTEAVTGYTSLNLDEFLQLAASTVWTGTNAKGEPGIGMMEVIGFAWAANTFAHFGLIDMALLRYAKKKIYGLNSAAGMMFGHYVAWISAGFMGAAVAELTKTSIVLLDPGKVAWYALAWSGFVVVVVAGWTTANSNLYRAGLAAQAVFPNQNRTKVTLLVGLVVVVASCFPFVYQQILPLLAYSGVLLVPIGGIVFAEHYVFRWLGYTRFWYRFKGLKHNVPALVSWAVSLVVGFGLDILDVMPYFYIFLPTWVVSIIVYVVLAKHYGAAEKFPEEEEAERQFQARVVEWQTRQAVAARNTELKDTSALFNERVAEYEAEQAMAKRPAPVKDRSLLTKVIKAVWIMIGLVLPFVLAWITLFHSANLYDYYVNVERFYNVTIVCTFIYFIFAYWDLRRAKAFRRRG
jgi:purine-cytosine permease-like protein